MDSVPAHPYIWIRIIKVPHGDKFTYGLFGNIRAWVRVKEKYIRLDSNIIQCRTVLHCF
jgi:hypothetical protein